MISHEATDGEEALRVLREAVSAGVPFDVTILDVDLVPMDGMTLSRLIKSDEDLAQTNIIMLDLVDLLLHSGTEPGLLVAGPMLR